MFHLILYTMERKKSINEFCIGHDFIKEDGEGDMFWETPAIDAAFNSVIQLESQFWIYFQQLVEGKFVAELQLERKEGEIILITHKDVDRDDIGNMIILVIVGDTTKLVEVVFGIEINLFRIQVGLFTAVQKELTQFLILVEEVAIAQGFEGFLDGGNWLWSNLAVIDIVNDEGLDT